MTLDQWIASTEALLEMDAKGALVPHGIGGHARTLLTDALARSMTLPNAVPDGRISDERLAEFVAELRLDADRTELGRPTPVGDVQRLRKAADLIEQAAIKLQSLRSSPSCGGGVKKLEWFDNPAGSGGVNATTQVGIYSVDDDHRMIAPGVWPPQTFSNIEDAKAAAQADFDQRIRSALEPAEDEPKRWLIEETMPPSGVIRWHVTEHENHARELARSLANPTVITALFTRPISPAPAMVDEPQSFVWTDAMYRAFDMLPGKPRPHIDVLQALCAALTQGGKPNGLR